MPNSTWATSMRSAKECRKTIHWLPHGIGKLPSRDTQTLKADLAFCTPLARVSCKMMCRLQTGPGKRPNRVTQARNTISALFAFWAKACPKTLRNRISGLT